MNHCLHDFLHLDCERPHALDGFHARLAATCALHNVCIWLNRQLGRPNLAFAELIDWYTPSGLELGPLPRPSGLSRLPPKTDGDGSPELRGVMPESAKRRALEAIEKLPEDASIEEVMERLYFVSKVERGLQQADAGQVVSHAEAKRRLSP